MRSSRFYVSYVEYRHQCGGRRENLGLLCDDESGERSKEVGLSAQNIQQLLVIITSVLSSVHYLTCYVMLWVNFFNDHTLCFERLIIEQLIKNFLSVVEL